MSCVRPFPQFAKPCQCSCTFSFLSKSINERWLDPDSQNFQPSNQDRQQMPKNVGTLMSIFLLVVIQKDAQHVKASPGNHMVHIALLCLDIV